jgi:hypothetical protein
VADDLIKDQIRKLVGEALDPDLDELEGAALNRVHRLAHCIRVNEKEKHDLLLLLQVFIFAKNAVDLDPTNDKRSFDRLRLLVRMTELQ